MAVDARWPGSSGWGRTSPCKSPQRWKPQDGVKEDDFRIGEEEHARGGLGGRFSAVVQVRSRVGLSWHGCRPFSNPVVNCRTLRCVWPRETGLPLVALVSPAVNDSIVVDVAGGVRRGNASSRPVRRHRPPAPPPGDRSRWFCRPGRPGPSRWRPRAKWRRGGPCSAGSGCGPSPRLFVGHPVASRLFSGVGQALGHVQRGIRFPTVGPPDRRHQVFGHGSPPVPSPGSDQPSVGAWDEG